MVYYKCLYTVYTRAVPKVGVRDPQRSMNGFQGVPGKKEDNLFNLFF